MSAEFLFNRGALRMARRAWEEKRERNREKAVKLSDELKELCVRASPALQSLATDAGVPIEQLNSSRTPGYGLRRYRCVGPREQIGPESLQWKDLGIDWESDTGKAIQTKICTRWLTLIRPLVAFLMDNNLMGGLESAAATDAVLLCQTVIGDPGTAIAIGLLEDMWFESSEWVLLSSHMEDYLKKCQCALCSAKIGHDLHLCGDCTAHVATLDGFLMLWDIAPIESCSEFSSWVDLRNAACRLFGHSRFTSTTLKHLTLWLENRRQQGQQIYGKSEGVLGLVQREAAKKEIAPDDGRLRVERAESSGGDQTEIAEVADELERQQQCPLQSSLCVATTAGPAIAGHLRKVDKSWLHDIDAEPPDGFDKEPVSGTQAELGFVVRPSIRQPKTTKTYLDDLKKAATQKSPKIWVRRTTNRICIEAFFRDPEKTSEAKKRLLKYHDSEPTVVDDNSR